MRHWGWQRCHFDPFFAGGAAPRGTILACAGGQSAFGMIARVRRRKPMNSATIDPARTALIQVDLQNSNVSRPLAPYTGLEVVSNSVRAAKVLRERGASVVFVRVLVDQILKLPADAPLTRDPAAPPLPPDACDIVPEAAFTPGDVLITKRQWGAFYGTELDQVLRRRAIRTLVMTGIVTNLGVESTARAAFDRGYELVFLEDAMSGLTAEQHQFALREIFPHMGRVLSTDAFIQGI
jgi:nicotinamidase-related amidase